jgi:hypothetical protein
MGLLPVSYRMILLIEGYYMNYNNFINLKGNSTPEMNKGDALVKIFFLFCDIC